MKLATIIENDLGPTQIDPNQGAVAPNDLTRTGHSDLTTIQQRQAEIARMVMNHREVIKKMAGRLYKVELGQQDLLKRLIKVEDGKHVFDGGDLGDDLDNTVLDGT